MPKPTHVVLIHGFASGADKHWFPWLHAELEKLNLRVTVPTMPNPIRPKYRDWMRAGLPLVQHWGPDTIIVAHSVGAPFALRLMLEAARKKVHAVILVAPPFASFVSLPQMLKLFGQKIDWRKLRALSGVYEVIHAKNDPLVPFDHGMRYAEALDAEMHLFESGGHLNKRTLPFLLQRIKTYL